MTQQISSSAPRAGLSVKTVFVATIASCLGFIDRLSAVINVAHAVENRRAPDVNDLRMLGIDSDISFPQV